MKDTFTGCWSYIKSKILQEDSVAHLAIDWTPSVDLWEITVYTMKFEMYPLGGQVYVLTEVD